jgi:hypothetical protein
MRLYGTPGGGGATFVLGSPPDCLRATFVLACPPGRLRLNVPNVRSDEGGATLQKSRNSHPYARAGAHATEGLPGGELRPGGAVDLNERVGNQSAQPSKSIPTLEEDRDLRAKATIESQIGTGW